MDGPTAADSIVLVGGPGPEHFAPILVLVVALAGVAAGVAMARRDQREAWALVALFGVLTLGAMLALAHLPTRLVLGRTGVDLAFWSFGGHRDWSEIGPVEVRRGWFGLRVSFGAQGRAPLPFRLGSAGLGLLAADAALLEPQAIAQRVESWRGTAKR